MDETQQYLAWVGQQVLQRQLAEQQEQADRLTSEQVQRRHVQARNRAERDAMIEQARARAAKFEAQRERETAALRHAEDIGIENEIKEKEFQAWLSVPGNSEASFHDYWPQRWLQIQQERVAESRRRSATLNAF